MKILYADLYFFLNLLVDYLLCLATGRLLALPLRRLRYGAAALFGACYALFLLLPLPLFLAAPPLRLAAGLVMGLIAFGREAHPLPCALCLLAVTAAFGGGLYALSLMAGGPPRLDLRLFAALFLLFYGLLRLLSGFSSRHRGTPRAGIRLSHLGRELHFTALVDSGNAARDPITGLALLIVCPEVLAPLFPAIPPQISPVELVERLSGDPAWHGKLRLAPFRSLGGSGVLPVFRPEGLWIDGARREDLLIALSPLARGDGFDAIL